MYPRISAKTERKNEKIIQQKTLTNTNGIIAFNFIFYKLNTEKYTINNC